MDGRVDGGRQMDIQWMHGRWGSRNSGHFTDVIFYAPYIVYCCRGLISFFAEDETLGSQASQVSTFSDNFNKSLVTFFLL